MKTLMLIVLTLVGALSPAFGQKENTSIRMGVGRASMERANIASHTNPTLRLVIDETEAEALDVDKTMRREAFNLLGAELGVEWIGNAYHVWSNARYTGGKPESTLFRVDNRVAIVEVQETRLVSLSSRPGGVVPFFKDGEKKFSENFAVTTLGDHEASLVIAGRVKLELKWTVEPIVMAYACDAGGGTGVTVVEMYTYWFDQPPTSTEDIKLVVNGRPITISGAILDEDLLKINVFVDSIDYQELFNDYAEWDPLPVHIRTTGPIPLLEREVVFPPKSRVGHC